MRLEAFAKINWSLDITGVREDGYHFMDMLMQPVSLADEISLLPSDRLMVSSSGYPRVREDESNLAYRAAEALRLSAGISRGASIHVHKRIPMGAGLGGGSADAAAVLFGLNRLWNTGFSLSELEKIGLSIGADIPFCLRGGLTRTRGIGDEMENHICRYSYRLVLVQPARGLSTKEVFQAWEESSCSYHPDTASALSALESGNLSLLSKSIRNVLQPVSVAMRPEIGESIRLLMESGACVALMTGSGSAVFGVFRLAKDAEAACQTLRRRWRSVFLCHTQSDSIRIKEE